MAIEIRASFTRCSECDGSGKLYGDPLIDPPWDWDRCVCGGSGFYPSSTSAGLALLKHKRQEAAERPAFSVEGISDR